MGNATAVVLNACEPLADFHVAGNEIELTVASPRSLVSLALRADAAEDREALDRALGNALPSVGSRTPSRFAQGAWLLGLQADQWFLALPAMNDPVDAVRAVVGEAPALTDQSDAWVSLELEGPRAVAALERVCRLNLHLDTFPADRVQRTAIEHMAAIIIREQQHRFVLLSPRSSAASFAHALEVSVRNVS